MSRQIGLFDAGPEGGSAPSVIADDAQGTIVYYPDVFSGAQSTGIFASLHAELPWRHESRRMYDAIVDVPRLTAHYGDLRALPAALQSVRERVEALLGVAFRSVGVNLYRDGNDSVAWHNDDISIYGLQPVIALASFGAAREMHLRRKADRRTRRWILEPGSVLVMSGASQEFWEHHIPKVARPLDARISVALRTSAHG